MKTYNRPDHLEVRVLWLDAVGHNGTLADGEELEPVPRWSYGALIRVHETYITLAQTDDALAPDTPITIPVGIIERIEKVTDKGWKRVKSLPTT